MNKAILGATLLLLVIVGFSHAGVYYVWGPEELEPTWSVLNAIVQLIDSSVYKSALLVFLLLGLIMLALGQLGSPRLGTIGWFVLIVLGIHVFLYGFRTTTRIHDITCDGWRTPINCDRTVDNVPSLLDDILGLMGAINKLAEHIGVTYGSISGGFPSKVRCTEALTSLTLNHLRDTDTRENFIRYVTSCVVPCSYIDGDLWKRIADSEDLLNALTMPASCSFLEVYDPSTGTNVSCVNFYTTKIYPNFSGSLDLTLDSDWYDKVITRYCSTALSAGLAYGGKNNLPPDDIARQAILTEGLLVALQQAGGGVEENLKTRMILTNQKLTTRSVLKAMSDWLREVFPMLKAVSQVFLIAFFPFALMFALLPISMRGLSLYFLSLIGVAFWSPAMAIANAVVNWFGEWQTSVLMYSPALIYELKEKLWLTGAIGAIAYAIIPVVLGLFTGGMVAGVWRAVFGAGSPVHLPETAKHQASDPLGAQRASAELAQRTSYEQRSELISAGMFHGMLDAQKGISTAQTSIAHGVGGATAGGILGTKEGIGISWGGEKLSSAYDWLAKNRTDLLQHGYRASITDTGQIAIKDMTTGENVGLVDPMTGMVTLAKPDLALSALLTRGWQKISAAVRDQSFRDAYSIAWNKAYGHGINKGIDKMAQDLEAYSHTQAGAEYRQFVKRIANETQSSEQDVHKAVSILQASAGSDGRLTVKEAQKAMNEALKAGGRVANVVSALLKKFGFNVGVNLTGRGDSISEHGSMYTVSSSLGDSYAVDWRTSDEWRVMTQTTASVARRYGENWSEEEKNSFDKNMGVALTLSNTETASEIFGVNTGVDLQRDLDRWAREKYGYGAYLRLLDTPEGRERLLREYIQDKLSDRLPTFGNVREKEKALSNFMDLSEVSASWGKFVKTGDAQHLKNLGLSDDQINNIKEILHSDGERKAYSALLDALIVNKVAEKVPNEISQAPADVENVKNLNVDGVDKETAKAHIQNTEETIDQGKAGLKKPSADNARKPVSLMEAVSRVPHEAVGAGAVLGLLTLGAEKGLDWLLSRRTRGGGNILDELFTKEEQKELRELRERALKGDTKASQEYLERWQRRMAEIERTDPVRYQKIKNALGKVENIMEDKGVINRIRNVVSDMAEKIPQYARKVGSVLGEVAKVLGVADLLLDTTPAYAPTLEVQTPYGTFNKVQLADYGLTIDAKGNLKVSENITPEQREMLMSLGINATPGHRLEGREIEIVRDMFALENQPIIMSSDTLNNLDKEELSFILQTQHERPVIVNGKRVMLDSEGYVYDYNRLADYGLTIDAKGNLKVSENITPEQREMLMKYGVDSQDIQTGYLPPDAENRIRNDLALYKPNQPPPIGV